MPIEIDANGEQLTPPLIRSAIARVPSELLAGAIWQMSVDRCAQWESCSLMVTSIVRHPAPDFDDCRRCGYPRIDHPVRFSHSDSDLEDPEPDCEGWLPKTVDMMKREAQSTMGGIPIQREPWMRDDYAILYCSRMGGVAVVIFNLAVVREPAV